MCHTVKGFSFQITCIVQKIQPVHGLIGLFESYVKLRSEV